MKKQTILFTLMLLAGIASAQQIRYIYRPGEGERQMGVILGPTIGQQFMEVQMGNDDPQRINNLMGFSAGVFWGYETDHGWVIDFGNHAQLLYSFLPFSGKVEFTDANGSKSSSRVGFNAQQVRFYENPFLAYRVNEQLIINAGVGMGINAGIPSKFRRDGVSAKAQYNILTSLYADFDANIGAKYYITDDLFVGLHVHWAFYSFDIRDLMEADESWTKDFVGGISFPDDPEKEPNCVYLPTAKPFQVMFSFGHTW